MVNLKTYASNVVVTAGNTGELIPSGGAGAGIATVGTDNDDFGRIIKEFEGVMYTVLQSVSTSAQTSTLSIVGSVDGGATWKTVKKLPSVSSTAGHQLVGFDATKTTSGKTMVYVSEFVKPTTAGTQMIRTYAVDVESWSLVTTAVTPNMSDSNAYSFQEVTIGFPSGTPSSKVINLIPRGGRGAMEATSKGLHLAMSLNVVGSTGNNRVIYFFIAINSAGAISAPVATEEIFNDGGATNLIPSTPSIYVDANDVPTLAFGTKTAYTGATGSDVYTNLQIWRKNTTLPIKRTTHNNIWSMNTAWSSVTPGGNSASTTLLPPRCVNLRFVPKAQSSQGVDTWYASFVYTKDGESGDTKRIGVIQSIDNGVTWSNLTAMETGETFKSIWSYEEIGQLAFSVGGDGREFLSWVYYYGYSSYGFKLIQYRSTKLGNGSWSTPEVSPQLDISESTNTALNKGVIVGSLPVSPRILTNQPMLRASNKEGLAGVKYYGDAEIGTMSDVVEFPPSTTPPTVTVDVKSLVPGSILRVVAKGDTDTVLYTENVPSTGIVKRSVAVPTATWKSLPYGSYRNGNNQRLAVASQLLIGGQVVGEKEDLLCKVLPTDSKMPEILTASSDLSNRTLSSVHSSIKEFVAKAQSSSSSASLGTSSDMLKSIKIPVEADMTLTTTSTTYSFRTGSGGTVSSAYVTVDTSQLGFVPDSMVISDATSTNGVTFWQRTDMVKLANGDRYNCVLSDGGSAYTAIVAYSEGLMKFPMLNKNSLVNIKFKGVK